MSTKRASAREKSDLYKFSVKRIDLFRAIKRVVREAATAQGEPDWFPTPQSYEVYLDEITRGLIASGQIDGGLPDCFSYPETDSIIITSKREPSEEDEKEMAVEALAKQMSDLPKHVARRLIEMASSPDSSNDDLVNYCRHGKKQ